MTQILYHAVTGATGAQGGATARALLAAGQRVRALTRRQETAAELAALGADVVYADFRDPSTLATALSGVDTLFAVTTPFETDPAAEAADGRRLIDAAADVGHIVFTSAANADRDTGIPHFDSKYEIERHLAAQPVPWTILGPAAFMDNFAGGWHRSSYARGVVSLPMPPEKPLALIAVADIGAFAAHVLTHPGAFAGRRIDLAGDELTGEQIADVLGMRFEEASLATIARHSEDLAAMFRYFGTTGMAVDIASLRHEHPHIAWHTLRDWARTALNH